jgi:hypothetical protein
MPLICLLLRRHAAYDPRQPWRNAASTRLQRDPRHALQWTKGRPQFTEALRYAFSELR